MKIGFTGTSHGMSQAQHTSLRNFLFRMKDKPTELHVGDCLGADEECFLLMLKLFPKLKTIGHIPDNDKKRAFCNYTEQYSPKPYLERNHDIVDDSDIMIATPRLDTEELRSGTWATVRYARTKGRTVFIIFPNGRIEVRKP